MTDFLNTHFIAMIIGLPVLALFLTSVTAPEVLMAFLNMDSFKDAWVLTLAPLMILVTIFCIFQKIKYDQAIILKQLVPQILLEKREPIDEIEEQCGIPPPLRQPEALNFHRDIMNQDIFSHFEELPLPDYLESARDQ